MRHIVLAVLFLSLVGIAFGQGRHQGTYDSLGGFGSVLYPGTGHPPPHPPGGITDPTFAGRFGATVAGRGVFANPVPANHPQHGRTIIVPYPVFYGGSYGYDQPQAYAPEQAPPIVNTNASPSVVINQSFVPQRANPQIREYVPNDSDAPEQSGMRLYRAPSHPYEDAADSAPRPQRHAADDQPTLYLIAFKDHSIVQALGYWMEGPTLHYVSVEHTLNQASLDLIDRDLSQRLNDERGVEFKLPPAK